jgi:hypothetical protein
MVNEAIDAGKCFKLSAIDRAPSSLI